MVHRLAAFASIAMLAMLANGCAEQPERPRQVVVHRPLMDRYYANDVIASRPPPRFVIEPVQPRRGYVWAHGYSRWDGHGYIAVPGHWIPEKPGYRYVDASWEQHHDGWHFRPGRWIFL